MMFFYATGITLTSIAFKRTKSKEQIIINASKMLLQCCYNSYVDILFQVTNYIFIHNMLKKTFMFLFSQDKQQLLMAHDIKHKQSSTKACD